MDFEKSQIPFPEGFDIRYTQESDAAALREWLLDPATQAQFPMRGAQEVEDAVGRWIQFSKYKCSLTATLNGEPCGLATLYLQAYRTLAHQCEFGIIVSHKHRGIGVGTHLLRNIMHLAKSEFKIEIIHLQVHAENPAMNLYKKFGFVEFGRQNQWFKDEGSYFGRVFMERYL